MNRSLARLPALLAVAALAACGGVTPGSIPTGGFAAPNAAAVRSPLASPICPKVGTVLKQHEATVTVVGATAFAGSSGAANWRIDYSGLTPAQADDLPTWRPVLLGCNPKNPHVGSIQVYASEHGKSCSNNVCSAHLVYKVRLTAPSTLPGNKQLWQLVRFAPKPNTRYKFFDGIVWHIKPFPPHR